MCIFLIFYYVTGSFSSRLPQNNNDENVRMSKQNQDIKNLDSSVNRAKSHENVAKRKINSNNKIIQPMINQTEIQVILFII